MQKEINTKLSTTDIKPLLQNKADTVRVREVSEKISSISDFIRYEIMTDVDMKFSNFRRDFTQKVD